MKQPTVFLMSVTLGLIAALSGLAGCESSPEAQSANATEGVLGFAPPITYGDTVSGQIAAPQIDVWALDVKAGDKLRLEETVTSGDLKPDIVLFLGASANHVSSDDFDVSTSTLTKDYTLDRNARYFVVVRGYQGHGSGSYTLSATCLGGPCAGEVPPPPVVELSEQEKQECVAKSRVCALDKLPEYNGAVGAVRSQTVWDECISQTTIETAVSDVPATCATACQGEEAAPVCEALVAMLPWLADQTSACVGKFNECIGACYDAGYGQADEGIEYGGEAVCTTGIAAFNGSCNDVRDLQVCGGPWAADSCEACYIECHYTSGAWIDDLDTICSETCDCEPSDDL